MPARGVASPAAGSMWILVTLSLPLAQSDESVFTRRLGEWDMKSSRAPTSGFIGTVSRRWSGRAHGETVRPLTLLATRRDPQNFTSDQMWTAFPWSNSAASRARQFVLKRIRSGSMTFEGDEGRQKTGEGVLALEGVIALGVLGEASGLSCSLQNSASDMMRTGSILSASCTTERPRTTGMSLCARRASI